MNKKTLFFTWSVLLCSQQLLNAQKAADQWQRQFNSSVIARVSEVSFRTKLPVDRQILLAKYFVKRDSLIARAAQDQPDSAKMEELLTGFNREFDFLLTQYERTTYYAAVNRNYMEWGAKQVAGYLEKKYRAGAEIHGWVYRAELMKNKTLNEAFATSGDADMSGWIQMQLNRYDSLYSIYKTAAAGEEYLARTLQSLEGVKPLEEREKTIIRNNYRALCLSKGDDYYRNFQTALKFIAYKKEYYDLLYKDSLEQVALTKTKNELQDLSFKYVLADTLTRILKPLLLEKNRKELELEIRHPYGVKRDSLIRENHAKHLALIKKTLIRAGHYRLGDSRFVYAMRYEKILKLSPAQLDSLALKHYQMDLMSYQYSLYDPWNKFDGSAFTNYSLEKILTTGQYDTLLRLESRPKALSNTKRNWEDLKKYDLALEYDSTKVNNEMFAYHMICTMITRRYGSNDTRLNQLLQNIEDKRPQVLRRLEAVAKLKEYETSVKK